MLRKFGEIPKAGFSPLISPLRNLVLCSPLHPHKKRESNSFALHFHENFNSTLKDNGVYSCSSSIHTPPHIIYNRVLYNQQTMLTKERGSRPNLRKYTRYYTYSLIRSCVCINTIYWMSI